MLRLIEFGEVYSLGICSQAGTAHLVGLPGSEVYSLGICSQAGTVPTITGAMVAVYSLGICSQAGTRQLPGVPRPESILWGFAVKPEQQMHLRRMERQSIHWGFAVKPELRCNGVVA